MGWRFAVACMLAWASRSAAVTLPPGFDEQIVLRGLNTPVAMDFAADGRVFVAEKRGTIQVFDNLDDPTPQLFADLRTQVHNYWDRGLLGLALHPDFPATPLVYVLYTFDAAIGGMPPVWGQSGQDSDPCPNPPGPTAAGCMVSGRLSVLEAAGNVAAGPERVLVENWCQQFPSHSMGDIAFGADGALYVTGGDGASFNSTDYGQFGSPLNPCGDPPVGVGGTQAPPGAMGGALRAQSPRRPPGTPAVYNGAVLRLDPTTGEALPDNPFAGSDRPGLDRIVAYGLRNPFRIAVRPGTSELWVGDVGWDLAEEINRIDDPGDAVVENFGWPCYEGTGRQGAYEGLGLSLCRTLYEEPGAVTAPVFTYIHGEPVVAGEDCTTGTQSLSGLAFYAGGSYPAEYLGALFFADYSRQCIWMMPAGPDGAPDPARRRTFITGATAVDLTTGPDGDLYYVDPESGTVRRVRFFATNQPPRVVVSASPTSGTVPLLVSFDASQSNDPDPVDTLGFTWDLDGDGTYDDAIGPTAMYTYTETGQVLAAVRVTDSRGLSSTAIIDIRAGDAPPVAVIESPAAGATWRVGETIVLNGSATDASEGPLPPSALTWSVILHHCPNDDCHTHPIQEFPGTASTSFVGPDHAYPSFLEIRLEAMDASGLSDTRSVEIHPDTVMLTFASDPPGLELVVGSERAAAPFARTVIVGSATTMSAATPQVLDGTSYEFVSWSDGGPLTHVITAGDQPTTMIAEFAAVGPTPTETPPVALPTDIPTPGVSSCPGDCNGDRQTMINELVIAVTIAIDSNELATCAAADADGDGEVRITDLIRGVDALLDGCP